MVAKFMAVCLLVVSAFALPQKLQPTEDFDFFEDVDLLDYEEGMTCSGLRCRLTQKVQQWATKNQHKISSAVWKQLYTKASKVAYQHSIATVQAHLPMKYKTTQCMDVQTKMNKFQGLVKELVEDPLSYVHDNAEGIHKQLLEVLKIENAMKNVKDGLSITSNLLAVLGKLPYAGPVLSAFKITLDRTVRPSVDKVYNKAKGFNDGTTRKIEPKFGLIVNKTETAANNVEAAKIVYEEYVNKPLSFVDNTFTSICPHQKITPPVCSQISNVIATGNSVLSTVKSQINIYKGAINQLKNLLTPFLNVFYGVAMGNFMKVATSLANLLSPLKSILSRKIEVGLTVEVGTTQKCESVPYICGATKSCCKRKKIGRRRRCVCWRAVDRWCHKQVCVPVPVMQFKTFSFSVQQIINGITGLADVVMNALNNALENLVRQIGIPKLSLNLPAFPDLSLSLDVPNMHVPSFVADICGVDVTKTTVTSLKQCGVVKKFFDMVNGLGCAQI